MGLCVCVCACVCVCVFASEDPASSQLENRVGSSDYYHHLFTSELIAELISLGSQFADYSCSPSRPPLSFTLLIGLLYE